MKILFIENRYKTILWEFVAKELLKDGIEVNWLVQNRTFIPQIGNIYIIPYPKGNKEVSELNKSKEIFSFIKSTDRIINYFGGKDYHYEYYYNKIEEIIDDVNPNLVIGESTLFHELMCIDICKEKGILYLNPSSIGYPPERFSFYLYDTKLPYKGSMEEISLEEANLLIEKINKRNVVPDYMKKDYNCDSKFFRKNSILDRFTILKSYIEGEIFNTPSPIKKLIKDFEVKRILREWNRVAIRDINILRNKKTVLYPMQLQPEANIDVYGNRYRNQDKLIESIVKVLPSDWYLVIKLNPKVKYEINRNLINLVKNKSNIIPLHSDVSMKDIFGLINLIITVTGTIAIESVLANKPVGVLGQGIVCAFRGVYKMQKENDIVNMIKLIEENKFDFPDDNDKYMLVNTLIASSYKGLISDPISNPCAIRKENIRLIKTAIQSVLR